MLDKNVIYEYKVQFQHGIKENVLHIRESHMNFACTRMIYNTEEYWGSIAIPLGQLYAIEYISENLCIVYSENRLNISDGKITAYDD